MSYYPHGPPPYDQHPPPPPPHHHPHPPHHHPYPPHHHPHPPPPPHHHPHPPPPPHHHPHPPTIAYMPTPVMMPVYPQQPAVYPAVPEYHGPPAQETVSVVENTPNTGFEDVIDWKPTTANTAHNFANVAVVAGHEGHDGSPLWVIRARHNGDCIPGKLAIKHRSAYIPNAGKEIPVNNFEVLCSKPGALRWLPASNGQLPIGAFAAGNTATAEPLYVGRTRHMLSLTPGKIHPSHKCCYISFGGNEIASKTYEVLCKVIG